MALTEITSKSIKDGEIVNADINASADIAGSKIADNAITLAKMAGGTDGQIITYDASGDPVAVGPGTDGQVLTSTGAGSPPAFEDLPASGPSLANDANNRVITGTGSGLNGEANLTFDGSKLDVTSPSTAANDSEPIAVFTTQGHCQVRLDGDGNKWSLLALDSADAGDHFIIYDKNNSLERLRIQSDGHVKINDGNLLMGGTGHGIDFSGSQTNEAGMTSELLDSYEEGTWTPISTNDATYHSQLGSYTKIGRFVFVFFNFQINQINSGATNAIYGLPFTVSPNQGFGQHGVLSSFSTSVRSLVPYAEGSTRIMFHSITTSDQFSLNTSIFGNGSRVDGSICYQTSD